METSDLLSIPIGGVTVQHHSQPNLNENTPLPSTATALDLDGSSAPTLLFQICDAITSAPYPISKPQEEVVLALVKQYAQLYDINVQYLEPLANQSLLHFCCRYNYFYTAKYLIENKSSIDIPCIAQNQTILTLLCQKDIINEQIILFVRYLLTKNCTILPISIISLLKRKTLTPQQIDLGLDLLSQSNISEHYFYEIFAIWVNRIKFCQENAHIYTRLEHIILQLSSFGTLVPILVKLNLYLTSFSHYDTILSKIQHIITKELQPRLTYVPTLQKSYFSLSIPTARNSDELEEIDDDDLNEYYLVLKQFPMQNPIYRLFQHQFPFTKTTYSLLLQLLHLKVPILYPHNYIEHILSYALNQYNYFVYNQRCVGEYMIKFQLFDIDVLNKEDTQPDPVDAGNDNTKMTPASCISFELEPKVQIIHHIRNELSTIPPTNITNFDLLSYIVTLSDAQRFRGQFRYVNEDILSQLLDTIQTYNLKPSHVANQTVEIPNLPPITSSQVPAVLNTQHDSIHGDLSPTIQAPTWLTKPYYGQSLTIDNTDSEFNAVLPNNPSSEKKRDKKEKKSDSSMIITPSISSQLTKYNDLVTKYIAQQVELQAQSLTIPQLSDQSTNNTSGTSGGNAASFFPNNPSNTSNTSSITSHKGLNTTQLPQPNSPSIAPLSPPPFEKKSSKPNNGGSFLSSIKKFFGKKQSDELTNEQVIALSFYPNPEDLQCMLTFDQITDLKRYKAWWKEIILPKMYFKYYHRYTQSLQSTKGYTPLPSDLNMINVAIQSFLDADLVSLSTSTEEYSNNKFASYNKHGDPSDLAYSTDKHSDFLTEDDCYYPATDGGSSINKNNINLTNFESLYHEYTLVSSITPQLEQTFWQYHFQLFKRWGKAQHLSDNPLTDHILKNNLDYMSIIYDMPTRFSYDMLESIKHQSIMSYSQYYEEKKVNEKLIKEGKKPNNSKLFSTRTYDFTFSHDTVIDIINILIDLTDLNYNNASTFSKNVVNLHLDFNTIIYFAKQLNTLRLYYEQPLQDLLITLLMNITYNIDGIMKNLIIIDEIVANVASHIPAGAENNEKKLKQFITIKLYQQAYLLSTTIPKLFHIIVPQLYFQDLTFHPLTLSAKMALPYPSRLPLQGYGEYDFSSPIYHRLPFILSTHLNTNINPYFLLLIYHYTYTDFTKASFGIQSLFNNNKMNASKKLSPYILWQMNPLYITNILRTQITFLLTAEHTENYSANVSLLLQHLFGTAPLNIPGIDEYLTLLQTLSNLHGNQANNHFTFNQNDDDTDVTFHTLTYLTTTVLNIYARRSLVHSNELWSIGNLYVLYQYITILETWLLTSNAVVDGDPLLFNPHGCNHNNRYQNNSIGDKPQNNLPQLVAPAEDSSPVVEDMNELDSHEFMLGSTQQPNLFYSVAVVLSYLLPLLDVNEVITNTIRPNSNGPAQYEWNVKKIQMYITKINKKLIKVKKLIFMKKNINYNLDEQIVSHGLGDDTGITQATVNIQISTAHPDNQSIEGVILTTSGSVDFSTPQHPLTSQIHPLSTSVSTVPLYLGEYLFGQLRYDPDLQSSLDYRCFNPQIIYLLGRLYSDPLVYKYKVIIPTILLLNHNVPHLVLLYMCMTYDTYKNRSLTQTDLNHFKTIFNLMKNNCQPTITTQDAQAKDTPGQLNDAFVIFSDLPLTYLHNNIMRYSINDMDINQLQNSLSPGSSPSLSSASSSGSDAKTKNKTPNKNAEKIYEKTYLYRILSSTPNKCTEEIVLLLLQSSLILINQSVVIDTQRFSKYNSVVSSASNTSTGVSTTASLSQQSNIPTLDLYYDDVTWGFPSISHQSLYYIYLSKLRDQCDRYKARMSFDPQTQCYTIASLLTPEQKNDNNRDDRSENDFIQNTTTFVQQYQGDYVVYQDNKYNIYHSYGVQRDFIDQYTAMGIFPNTPSTYMFLDILHDFIMSILYSQNHLTKYHIKLLHLLFVFGNKFLVNFIKQQVISLNSSNIGLAAIAAKECKDINSSQLTSSLITTCSVLSTDLLPTAAPPGISPYNINYTVSPARLATLESNEPMFITPYNTAFEPSIYNINQSLSSLLYHLKAPHNQYSVQFIEIMVKNSTFIHFNSLLAFLLSPHQQYSIYYNNIINKLLVPYITLIPTQWLLSSMLTSLNNISLLNILSHNYSTNFLFKQGELSKYLTAHKGNSNLLSTQLSTLPQTPPPQIKYSVDVIYRLLALGISFVEVSDFDFNYIMLKYSLSPITSYNDSINLKNQIYFDEVINRNYHNSSTISDDMVDNVNVLFTQKSGVIANSGSGTLQPLDFHAINSTLDLSVKNTKGKRLSLVQQQLKHRTSVEVTKLIQQLSIEEGSRDVTSERGCLSPVASSISPVVKPEESPLFLSTNNDSLSHVAHVAQMENQTQHSTNKVIVNTNTSITTFQAFFTQNCIDGVISFLHNNVITHKPTSNDSSGGGVSKEKTSIKNLFRESQYNSILETSQLPIGRLDTNSSPADHSISYTQRILRCLYFYSIKYHFPIINIQSENINKNSLIDTLYNIHQIKLNKSYQKQTNTSIAPVPYNSRLITYHPAVVSTEPLSSTDDIIERVKLYNKNTLIHEYITVQQTTQIISPLCPNITYPNIVIALLNHNQREQFIVQLLNHNVYNVISHYDIVFRYCFFFKHKQFNTSEQYLNILLNNNSSTHSTTFKQCTTTKAYQIIQKIMTLEAHNTTNNYTIYQNGDVDIDTISLSPTNTFKLLQDLTLESFLSHCIQSYNLNLSAYNTSNISAHIGGERDTSEQYFLIPTTPSTTSPGEIASPTIQSYIAQNIHSIDRQYITQVVCIGNITGNCQHVECNKALKSINMMRKPFIPQKTQQRMQQRKQQYQREFNSINGNNSTRGIKIISANSELKSTRTQFTKQLAESSVETVVPPQPSIFFEYNTYINTNTTPSIMMYIMYHVYNPLPDDILFLLNLNKYARNTNSEETANLITSQAAISTYISSNSDESSNLGEDFVVNVLQPIHNYTYQNLLMLAILRRWDENILILLYHHLITQLFILHYKYDPLHGPSTTYNHILFLLFNIVDLHKHNLVDYIVNSHTQHSAPNFVDLVVKDYRKYLQLVQTKF